MQETSVENKAGSSCLSILYDPLEDHVTDNPILASIVSLRKPHGRASRVYHEAKKVPRRKHARFLLARNVVLVPDCRWGFVRLRKGNDRSVESTLAFT